MDRWLIIKSRESWLSFFQRKGIAADAAKKLIDYLSSLPSINAVRKNIKKLTYSVRFNEKLVHHPYYDSWAFGPYIRKGND
ncbi:hypothetical protein SGB_05279 [Shigella boydii ATCC 9905]|nr:hypothetical protein SGB_05279 [Shigella boydii ATCC 9905]